MKRSFEGWRHSPLAAAGALLGATVIWGSSFPVVKDAVTPVGSMGPLDYLAWRFTLATLLMAAFRPRAVAALGPRGRGHGALIGLALGVGFVTQTVGLQRAPSSVAGFMTGMFVVFTPLVTAVLLRRRVARAAWLAVTVATVGLVLLSLGASGHDDTHATGLGLTLLAACAIAYAFQIVGLGEWSAMHDAYGLAVMQLATTAVLCAVGSLFEAGGLRPPATVGSWLAVVYTALAATALAFIVQTWAQAVLEPTRASVIMTMEPVWAGLTAVLFAGESMTAPAVVGGLLVIVAMLLTELTAGEPPTPGRIEP